jgi:signal transduction histidine kinase
VAPATRSLVALATPATRDAGAPSCWTELRQDPGAVLLLVRSASALLPTLSYFPALVSQPAVLELALDFLDQGLQPGALRWDQEPLAFLHRVSLGYAHRASLLAERTGACDPDNAWVAGLLAPLGWFGVAAVAPGAIGACLSHPEFAQDPAACQQRLWGLDHSACARRLARRWNLPPWLAAVAGHLSLPALHARRLGAEESLFRIVQLAVHLEQLDTPGGLRLAVAGSPAVLANELHWSLPELRELSAAEPETLPLPTREEVPLRLFLSQAAEQRRLRDAPVMHRLEAEVDELQHLLEEQEANAEEELRTQKLRSLAEFAAGAGHEINNPLAVISGQAQYLLSHQHDLLQPQTAGSACKALETIIAQTRRIHQLLREVMQFARPPAAARQRVDLAGLVGEASSALQEFAASRQVRLETHDLEKSVWVDADPGQVRTILTCLIRNALEAASAEGWVRVGVVTRPGNGVEVAVVDSGPGPLPAQREHLFDPFYSGRSAGRGAGLGLPLAWALARQQDGEVTLASQPSEPTCFVLRLPRFLDRPDALAS